MRHDLRARKMQQKIHLRIRTGLACGVLLPGLAVGTAVRADQPAKTARMPQIKFTDYRLPNGLRVILSVDHYAPVVAVSVTYNVGSRNEREGRTGFAHLFEHMMFQGSQNVGKGEHMLLIQDNGGTMNGTTNSGPHQLLRDRARQSTGNGAVPGSRPDARPGHQPDQSGQPARRRAGREAPDATTTSPMA